MMQPIVPFLWFDTQAEEAMAFYVAAFKNARIGAVYRFPAGPLEGPMQGLEGKVMTGVFELAGRRLMAFDGGPHFKFTPAISLFVDCETEDEIDRLWATLSAGGSVMMEYGEYPFSPKYGWLADKYGLSWQLCLSGRPQSVTPFLMFVGDEHGQAEEAMRFYTALFANSSIDLIKHVKAQDGGATGAVQYAVFSLDGQPFMAIDGSSKDHAFTFNEALSLCVECETQEEIDRLWNSLSAHPEAEQCGWLKDRFGVSWQIIPTVLYDFYTEPDPMRSKRVMDAMLQMKKLDIESLMKAHAG